MSSSIEPITKDSQVYVIHKYQQFNQITSHGILLTYILFDINFSIS